MVFSTIVESTVQNLTPKKSQGRHKAEHIMVTHPFGDHTQSCLTLALKSKCSCSVPLILQAIKIIDLIQRLTALSQCQSHLFKKINKSVYSFYIVYRYKTKVDQYFLYNTLIQCTGIKV